MNYLDKCINRISKSRHFTSHGCTTTTYEDQSRGPCTERYTTEADLTAKFYSEGEVRYSVSFQGVTVPLEEHEAEQVFNLLKDKTQEFNMMRAKETLDRL